MTRHNAKISLLTLSIVVISAAFLFDGFAWFGTLPGDLSSDSATKVAYYFPFTSIVVVSGLGYLWLRLLFRAIAQ